MMLKNEQLENDEEKRKLYVGLTNTHGQARGVAVAIP
jgi:hypothetical protein